MATSISRHKPKTEAAKHLALVLRGVFEDEGREGNEIELRLQSPTEAKDRGGLNHVYGRGG